MNPETENVDKLLASELEQLCIQERENILEEIHGVQSLAVPENPELLNKALRLLRVEIEKISMKKAYDLAVSNGYDYVLYDVPFRLKFLRATLFDEKKAAYLLVRHLDLLVKYFDRAALQRPLSVDLDLAGPEESKCLRVGNVQVLPSRDRAGRRVVVYQGSTASSSLARMKALIYFFSAISDDVETQKRGAVLIFSPDGGMADRMADMKARTMVLEVIQSLPLRFGAVHMCMGEGAVFRFLKRLSVVVFGRDNRIRMRWHEGLTTESRYELLGFGIPIHELPVTTSGSVKTKNHLLWIKTRQKLEKSRRENKDVDGMIESPDIHDVLFSQGSKHWMHHLGNSFFMEIVDSKIDAYRNAGVYSPSFKQATEKRNEIVHDIIRQVRDERLGRFIHCPKAGGHWVELVDSSPVLHEKVKRALLNRTRRLDASKNEQTSNGGTFKFANLDGSKRRRLSAGKDSIGSCGSGECEDSNGCDL